MPDMMKLREIFEGLLEVMRKADNVNDLGAPMAMALDQWQKDRSLTLDETNEMLTQMICAQKTVYADMNEEGLS